MSCTWCEVPPMHEDSFLFCFSLAPFNRVFGTTFGLFRRGSSIWIPQFSTYSNSSFSVKKLTSSLHVRDCILFVTWERRCVKVVVGSFFVTSWFALMFITLKANCIDIFKRNGFNFVTSWELSPTSSQWILCFVAFVRLFKMYCNGILVTFTTCVKMH